MHLKSMRFFCLNFQNNWTALLVAAKGGFTDVLKAILTRNPNLNAADKV